MSIKTRTELAPAIVFILALVHLTLLLSDSEFEAFRTLLSSTLVLIASGCITFGYLLSPVLYTWIGQERGGLSAQQVQEYGSFSRIITTYMSDQFGNLGILAFLGCTFSLVSYEQAIRTAALLYLGAVLPNAHHYFWEDRSLNLVCVEEAYQLVRRVAAACALVYFSLLWNETLPGFLWYGPILGTRVWLPSIREFKRDKSFSKDALQSEMNSLLAGGFVCGQMQNCLLLPLQAQMGSNTSLASALKLGYTLFFFYVLPTVSVDMWEGKPYRLSFVNYSNYLVELCLLFSINAIYQSM